MIKVVTQPFIQRRDGLTFLTKDNNPEEERISVLEAIKVLRIFSSRSSDPKSLVHGAKDFAIFRKLHISNVVIFYYLDVHGTEKNFILYKDYVYREEVYEVLKESIEQLIEFVS